MANSRTVIEPAGSSTGLSAERSRSKSSSVNPTVGGQLSYVLITPARNEGVYIEKTIESMIVQTVIPLKWVIVDDGSTDNTREIIARYLERYHWIEMVQMPERRDRSFAGKVVAFNAGYERVKDLPYDIVGNLDGDISFDKDHFEFLTARFSEDSTLGVAGTIFREEGGYSSDKDSFEGRKHVSGQCQLFRRKCWEEIGGYIPHRAGGIDWMAVTTARMKGWKTESFREKWFFHYRHLGTAERGVLASAFSYGEKDYYLGGHPDMGAVSCSLSLDQAALHSRGRSFRSRLLLGVHPTDASAGLSRTYGISSQGTDDQAQDHP